MDRKVNFKIKGGLNFLCIAGGISIIANAIIKLDKWATRDKELKLIEEAADAIKITDELVTRIEKCGTKKSESKEEEAN